LEPILRVQVSIDGGKSYIRENTNDPAGFTIKYQVCEKVDSCSPNSGGSCYDCHEGHNTVSVHGTRFGKGLKGDERNDDMVCGFGNIAVQAKWISPNLAECIVPPLNCTYQNNQCDAAFLNHKMNPTPPTPAGSPGPSNPDYSVPVRFNFSLDGGENWFPLNGTMDTFHYKPCRPVCEYVTDFKPFPLILLLLASLLFCLPPLALCIGSKQPLPMPPLEHSPEPEPPPPLVFKTVPTVVVKKVRRIKKKIPPKEKAKKKAAPPPKKKWDTVAAGQYIRGGKHVAVGWGKYGEAEHGEELMDGFEEEEESSEEEADEEEELEVAVALAFDDVEETIEMPQAPGMCNNCLILFF
jgi:hypothetical protein